MIRWSSRGMLRGAISGLAGLLAMSAYFKAISALSSERENSESNSDGEGPLDDVSVGGMNAREGEPSTEAVGRLAHEALIGDEPPKERKKKLGQAVHWGYGMLVGGLYGALREARKRDGLDVDSGLGYGAVLWLLGDEIAVPVLGLAKGPTAYPAGTHVQTLGAHLVYGAATAAANRALARMI